MTARPAAPVSVTTWAELATRGDAKLPGCLRVLVDGQSAGGCERKGDVWVAYWYTGMSGSGRMRDRLTEQATAEEAVKAVTRSLDVHAGDDDPGAVSDELCERALDLLRSG